MNFSQPRTADEVSTLVGPHIDAVYEGLQALAVILVREKTLLVETATESDLDSIAKDKETAVGNVAELYQMLRAVAGEPDGTSESGLDVAALKQASPALASRVEQLVKITQQCQLANQENGTLVNARLRATRSALDTLNEATAGDASAMSYGPTGAMAGARGDRLTVRA